MRSLTKLVIGTVRDGKHCVRVFVMIGAYGVQKMLPGFKAGCAHFVDG